MRLRSGRLRSPTLIRRVAAAVLVSMMAVVATVPFRANATTLGSSQPELGINVLLYPSPGSYAKVMSAAQRVFAYVRSLHANSVALNFYFYQSSPTASKVHAGIQTPSLSMLATIIDIARADGLQVQLRPVLNESLIKKDGGYRGGITPSNVSEWFTSYYDFLKPYMVMGRLHHVEGFAVGVELASLTKYDQYWETIVHAATELTGADVIYEANWNGQMSLPGAQFGLEFYEPLVGITSDGQATVANFTRSMEANLNNLQAGLYDALQTSKSEAMLTEVGVAAVEGSWLKPWKYPGVPDKSVVRSVQANWFTAACDTAQAMGLRGIYYWFVPLDANFEPTYNANTAKDPVQWENTATSKAISACFTSSNW